MDLVNVHRCYRIVKRNIWMHRFYDFLQIRVSRQDGSPITGTKQSVIIHTDISVPVRNSFATQYDQGLQISQSILHQTNPPVIYYWGQQTTNYKLDDQILTLPDTGLVAVKIQIPKNASKVNLHVCSNKQTFY